MPPRPPRRPRHSDRSRTRKLSRAEQDLKRAQRLSRHVIFRSNNAKDKAPPDIVEESDSSPPPSIAAAISDDEDDEQPVATTSAVRLEDGDADQHMKEEEWEEVEIPPIVDVLKIGEAPFFRESRDEYPWARDPANADLVPVVLHPPFRRVKGAAPTKPGNETLAPNPVTRLDIFGSSLTAPLQEFEKRELRKQGYDDELADEAWKGLQERERNRLFAVRLDEERYFNHMGQRRTFLSNCLNWHIYRRGTPHVGKPKQQAEKLRLIAEGARQIETKLRYAVARYKRSWQAIESNKGLFPLLDFREIPWPTQTGWAISPKQLTKDEIRRLLFSSCVVQASGASRAQAFKEALSLWNRKSFERRLLPWSQDRDEVLEGVSIVQANIEELEEEMEPTQAEERKKRRRDEEETRRQLENPERPVKRRRVFGEVWNKITDVFKVPTSFNFSAMT